MGNVIKLPVVVIKVADDNGDHDAGAAFSDETIWALIDDTNAIFEQDAGIRLVLQKITTIKNTLINRLTDWSVWGCPDAEQTIPNPDPNLAARGEKLSLCQKEAYDYAAKNYPDKIVVYIRRQTYVKDPPETDCRVVDDNGGGFSHYDLNFIALSSWGSNGTLGVFVYPGGPTPGQAPHSYLAHELGHYFGLTHTMPNDWPADEAEAIRQLEEYCKTHYRDPQAIPDNVADLVWNGDNLYDTPGDPGYDVYNNKLFGLTRRYPKRGGTTSDNANREKNQCIGDGEFKLHSDFYNREFIVKPARHNLMSYTAQCPYLLGNTTGETRARITSQQRDIIHTSLTTFRKNLGRVYIPRTLRKGLKGSKVKTLQCILNFSGANPRLQIDGNFGPKTEIAVKTYQESHRLVQDGIVGPKTWGVLLDIKQIMKGSTGIAVKILQCSLNSEGAVPALKVDGMFGPLTRDAVKAYQFNHGLVQDGIVGPKTWRRLLEVGL